MLHFFLKHKRSFLLLGLFLLALIFFSNVLESRTSYSLADRLFLRLLSPPLEFSTLCISQVSRLWHDYFYLVNLKKENAFLKEYIEKLEMQNQLLREEAVENSRLRELLSFKKKFAYHMLPAEIIGRDPSSWFKTILINKGSLDGIVHGTGVITPQGVVGKIVAVTPTTAKVLLITDINSAVDAVVERNRARGILEGSGGNACSLSYVVKTEDVAVNDVIISSGLHTVFPRGVFIGTVTRIDTSAQGFFQLVEVTPFVDFAKINEVLVVLKEGGA